jgi:hypothetical protein
MTAGFFGRVPRVALLVAVALLATATLTLAANSTVAPSTPPGPQAAIEPQTLVVPDVRRQAYVFAKGTLEQSGFAWRVAGSVKGYAANVVAEQTPAPGAKVIGNGAPIVVLRLSANGSYKEEGSPENVSPYVGTPARLVGAKRTVPKTKLKPAKQLAKQTAKKVVAAKPKPAAAPTAKDVPARTPAFVVKGAPKEPRDEISLAARAERLAAWLEAHKNRTPANVDYWLYQHNWIVTGAGFGWSHGAEALRTLVEVDTRVQALWSVGARSEQVARAALAEAEKSSR